MDTSRKIQQFLLRSLIPFACCIVVGLIFFPKDIFRPHMAAFQFVDSGIVASLFYNMMVFLKPRRAYVGLLFLYVMQLVLDGPLNPIAVLRDVCYIGGIGVAIVLFIRYFKPNLYTGYLYSAVTLAGLYPLVFIVATEINLVVLKTFGVPLIPYVAVMVQTSYMFAPGVLLALLVGFAAGVGIELSERLVAPTETHMAEAVPDGGNYAPN
ncbi:MAG: hypothetical protein M1469_03510 [Bacteroidetes bacterium]|nr:hypothetical protein [Bacteroidota bacterium]